MTRASPMLVTGAAVETGCGLGYDAFCMRLREGLPVDGHAAEPDSFRFAPLDDPARPARKFRTPHSLAVRLLEAIEHDLGEFLTVLTTAQRQNVGVTMGSAYVHLKSYFSYFETGTERGYQLVNPLHFPHVLPNYCTVQINDAYSLWGSSTAVGTGVSAGLEAIGYACDAIRCGSEGTVLAGGLDEINDFNQHVLKMAGMISPSSSVRPFGPDRDGTMPGEGIAVLLIQSAEAARECGREPLAHIYGVASTCGIHTEASDACSRAAATIQRSLGLAGVKTDDIDAVIPSANGSKAGDEFERQLLETVFGTRLPHCDVWPIKVLTGECFAASGALQTLAAVYAVSGAEQHEQMERPAIEGIEVRPTPTVRRRTTVLVYSAGYDGTFAAIVVRRPTE